jgi:hypothetical protein
MARRAGASAASGNGSSKFLSAFEVGLRSVISGSAGVPESEAPDHVDRFSTCVSIRSHQEHSRQKVLPYFQEHPNRRKTCDSAGPRPTGRRKR